MSKKYFEYEELLSPPIRRAAYSDRTAWLLAEMSRLANIKFEQSKNRIDQLEANLDRADFELIRSFEGPNKGTQAILVKRTRDCLYTAPH